MSEGLPAGFTIKSDDETPALPQGFVVKDAAKNNAPIPTLEAPEVEQKNGLGLGGKIAKSIALSPITQGVNLLFGKESNVARLSEDEQLSYLQDELTSSQADLENDQEQLDKIKALGRNDPETNLIIEQFEKRVELGRKLSLIHI